MINERDQCTYSVLFTRLCKGQQMSFCNQDIPTSSRNILPYKLLPQQFFLDNFFRKKWGFVSFDVREKEATIKCQRSDGYLNILILSIYPLYIVFSSSSFSVIMLNYFIQVMVL